MALPREEFRNRVKAGAALHGLGLRELRDVLERYGADRTLYQSMYSDERARGLPRNLRDLSEALGLPRKWFTEPDWRTLIPGAGELVEGPSREAAGLERDLEDAARQSESIDPHSEESKRESQNG